MAPRSQTTMLLLFGLVALCQIVRSGYSAGADARGGGLLSYSGRDSRRLVSSSSSRSSRSRIRRPPGSAIYLAADYTDTAHRDHEDDDDDDDRDKVCSLTDCMPYIRLEQTIQLSLEQRVQVRRKRRFLRRWRNAEKLRDAPSRIRHTAIVTLTAVQKSQILTLYGNYFSRQEDLPPTTATAPAAGARAVREKRGTVSICPRQELWDALVLGMTNDDELVQVVQFADTGDKQWILDERCTQEECSFVSNCGCVAHTRLVRATVISFDQLMVAEKYIKVYCCVAQLL